MLSCFALFCGQILKYAHAGYYGQSHKIGERIREHHAQSASRQHQPQDRVHLPEQRAVQGGRHTEEAHQRGDNNLDHLEDIGVHQQHGRVEGKDIRHNKGRNGQLGADPA